MAIRVNANPAMIKWARENAGYTFEDLPKTLKDAPEWENGTKKPTWADLRNLAKKYKRPSFFYFLSEPPKEEDDFIEFRSDEKIEEYSPELRLEIRKAKFRRNAYVRIRNDMDLPFLDFSTLTTYEQNPFKLAEHIRNYLNIDFQTQQKWLINSNGNKNYTHSNFLNQWKEVCFDLGILVFELDNVQEYEISGCSIYYDVCPIILINGKNTPNRRIFTLMHELTHLTQGNSAMCDVDKHNKKEAFCNKVAAEILVPKKTLKKENIFFKNGNVNLSKLSHMYGVSKQTIAYKLNSSGFINDSLKDSLVEEIEEKNWEDKNKRIKRKNNKDFKISVATQKKKYEGTPFTRLVFNAYDNNIITSVQATKYLDTSMDNFEKIKKGIGD